ncbi:hypothetical protein ACD591_19725 [Rufibacter glacialis]|uniref:Glycerophosphoryl diester phosphodiesterase membrane domain-containing protein n=1 Tax=Rufibacter glacialis TaxID=1259555 RepID=A0A5M8Q2X0_9BACT|nr:hypothetical protein [Rufibacter glacialis]KAA6430179.1 hypothetical protein FOE74_20390 [Rufibacter glacialis]GGK87080.1 hypothetical protein GCM10011405_38530 [Rufibacter glacialis]
MKDQLIELREERDLGQKLNATFAFLRQNYRPLARCILLYVVPFALLAGIFSGIYQSTQLAELSGNVRYGSLGAYAFASTINSGHYWVSIFFTLVSLVLLCITVYTYMLEYLAQGGKVENVAIWERIKGNFIPLLYSAVGAAVICGVAALLLVLPGIYVMVPLSLFAVVMLAEEVNFLDALERCFHLVKGRWWASFGFLLITFMLQGIIGFAASLPALVVYVFRILHLPGGESDLLLILASSFTTIVGLVLYVIAITAIGFLYFDLVERKDGLGLLEKVNQIGGPASGFSDIPQNQA